MRDTGGNAAAPAARCRNVRRGSFIMVPTHPLCRGDPMGMRARSRLRLSYSLVEAGNVACWLTGASIASPRCPLVGRQATSFARRAGSSSRPNGVTLLPLSRYARRQLILRCPKQTDAVSSLAPHFRLLVLGGGNRTVESGAQLLRRLQRQLDGGPRSGFEAGIDEVERDDIAERRMARV